MAKGGYPTSIGKMRQLRIAGFNSQYFGETICVYSLLERFDILRILIINDLLSRKFIADKQTIKLLSRYNTSSYKAYAAFYSFDR